MTRSTWLGIVVLLLPSCSDDACPEGGQCAVGGAGGGGAAGQASGGGGELAVGGDGVGAGQAGGAGGAAMGGATAESVTITATDISGEPGIGIDVVTNAADGSLVDAAVTGPDGAVELPVPAGGSVSLLYTVTYDESGNSTDRRIETIHFSGSPPDAVRFNTYFPAPTSMPNTFMTQNITWPPKGGSPTYDVKASCYGASTNQASYSKSNAPGCTLDGLYDVLVLARNSSGSVIDHGRVDDAAFVANGTSNHSISWTGLGTVPVELQAINIPTGAAAVGLSTASFKGHPGGYATGFEDGEVFNDPANEVSATVQQLPAYGTRHCRTITIDIQDSLAGQKFLVKQQCAPAADSTPMLFDAARLSRYEGSGTTTSPLSLQWDQTWEGEEGDVVVATLIWSHASATTLWSNYVEPAAGEAVFIELPGYLADYDFEEGDEITTTRANHHDYFGFDGFEAMVSTTGLPNVPEATSSSTEVYMSSQYP